MSPGPRFDLPIVDPDTQPFWDAARDGKLLIKRCSGCGRAFFYPRPFCPRCLSRDVRPQATSGRATVFSFTVNHQAWDPSWETPYAIALVELDEQPGLRLTTNVVGCPPEDVRIGMPVRVTFEQHGEVWVPLFATEARPA